MDKDEIMSKNPDVLWEVIETKDILVVENRLSISVQRIKLPDGRIIDDYYQIYLPECVVVVSRNEEGRTVMLEQYQHGFGRVSVVLPAGVIEKGESPLHAAQRELLEETGYSSEEWYSFGTFPLHNNYGCGKVNFFFAANVRQIAKPTSKDLEETKIILMDEQETINAIKKGDIIAIGSITALLLSKIILNKA
ncbi:MAG: NUDIX hydrolase [Elusimicrobia bacterium]|nr:NUDIX hydrolase [Elusimicrobiota bacterium]